MDEDEEKGKRVMLCWLIKKKNREGTAKAKRNVV